MDREQQRWHALIRLIKENGYKVIAEIGVRKGMNMNEVMTRCGDIYWHAIDPWKVCEGYPQWNKMTHEEAHKQFLARKQQYASRVTKWRMTSEEAAAQVPNHLDLVFIDGDHGYKMVELDIALWTPKVRPGGIISGHDYNNFPRFPGVMKAVDEAFGERVQTAPDHFWWVEL